MFDQPFDFWFPMRGFLFLLWWPRLVFAATAPTDPN
jgi:hypothetical protein